MATFLTDRNLKSRSRDTYIVSAASETEQKRKPRDDGEGEPPAKGDGTKKIAKRGADLKEDMDSLVDEIDSVLEENAEEFVKNYVQRGGE